MKDAGRIFEADSDQMHLMAKFGESEGHTFTCLPGCDEHGWSEVLTFTNGSQGTLIIESLPVTLPDDYPDDDDSGEDPDDESEDSGEDLVHPYVD